MNLTVQFLGAARNVTGSRHLVQAGSERVLVDCGLFQERHNAVHNWEPFPVTPSTIEAVVLTHAHIDHIGYLPRLVQKGFRGLTTCSSATREMVPLVLLDAARLQAEDVDAKRARHHVEGRTPAIPPEPLYDDEDVEAACQSLRGVAFGEKVMLTPSFQACLLPAGHILGASMLVLRHLPTQKTLLFSGDLGCPGRPLVPDPAEPPAADLVIVESTYGDRIHANETPVAEQLEQTLLETVERGGSLLIPCFAVERAQELLFHLRQLERAHRLPNIPVFLDSPMAARMLEVFAHHPEALAPRQRAEMADGESPFALSRLVVCTTREQSKLVNQTRGPAVIIAGSGMCTGGRIKHHLRSHLGRPESCLLFVGYQASGTLGRELLSGAPEVRLFGTRQEVRLAIRQIHGFSGHADQSQLLDWLSRMPSGPQRVAVVHGGSTVTAEFAARIRERFGCPTHVPELGERLTVSESL